MVRAGYEPETLITTFEKWSKDQNSYAKNIDYNFRNYRTSSDDAFLASQFTKYATFYKKVSIQAVGNQADDIASASDPLKFSNQLASKIDLIKEPTLTDEAVKSLNLIKEKTRSVLEERINLLLQQGSSDFTEISGFTDNKKLIEGELVKVSKVFSEEEKQVFFDPLYELVKHNSEALLKNEISKIEKESSRDINDTLALLKNVESAFANAGLEKEQKLYSAKANDVRKGLLDKALAKETSAFVSLDPTELSKEKIDSWGTIFAGLSTVPSKLQAKFGDYPVEIMATGEVKKIEQKISSIFESAIKKKMDSAFSAEGTKAVWLKKLANAQQVDFYKITSPDLDFLKGTQKKYAKSLLKNVLNREEKFAAKMKRILVAEAEDNFAKKETHKYAYSAWSDVRKHSIELNALAKVHSSFEDLAEEWQENETALAKYICKTKEELGNSDRRLPVLAGNGQVDLATLVCSLKINGAELTEFNSPGIIGDDHFTLKLLSESGFTVLKLKEVEVRPDEEVLVGFSKSDGIAEENFNRKTWAEYAGRILLEAERVSGADFGARKLLKTGDSKAIKLMDRVLQ